MRLTITAFALLTLFSQVLRAESNLAPNFALPSIYNDEVRQLEDYRGQLVLIDFWASWCGPCQTSLPAYDNLRKHLQSNYGEDAFEVLAINVDVTKEEGLQFLNKYPVSVPVLRESTGTTQQKYQLVGLPASFLIDQQGHVIIAHQGYSPAYLKYLQDEIEKRLSLLSDPTSEPKLESK